jgi:hypothetical protein
MGSYDFADPQSFNRYSYVEDLPLIATDLPAYFRDVV